MKKYALTLFGAALIAAAPAYYAFQAQAEDKPATSSSTTASAEDEAPDGGVAASASDTSNDNTVSTGSSSEQGSTRSPGSAPGESDVDASRSTDTVGE